MIPDFSFYKTLSKVFKISFVRCWQVLKYFGLHPFAHTQILIGISHLFKHGLFCMPCISSFICGANSLMFSFRNMHYKSRPFGRHSFFKNPSLLLPPIHLLLQRNPFPFFTKFFKFSSNFFSFPSNFFNLLPILSYSIINGAKKSNLRPEQRLFGFPLVGHYWQCRSTHS